tara:strand:- start:170 stop:949 length:780 start_codon:yes stop_codon:yes gene_type:complete
MISKLSFKERSVLFAKLSQIAYLDEKHATKKAKAMGYTTVEFYDIKGAQAYRFMNKHDLVIACRGTEPTEFNDIQADIDALPVVAETISRVHKGFKAEVDELWPCVLEDLERTANDKKKIWFCGHSLGAAMATIMASRCHLYPNVEPVEELYTYGSPRVGWSGYTKSLGIKHHRWVNNNDIVCRVPLWIMGYTHHGEEHYLNTWGNVRTPKGWQRTKDRFRGMWRGMKKGKIDNFSDHNIGDYITHIEKYSKGIETPQV